MGATTLLPGATFGILPSNRVISSCSTSDKNVFSNLCLVQQRHLVFSLSRLRKRKFLNSNGNWQWKSRTMVLSSMDDSNGSCAEMGDERCTEVPASEENELLATKKALSEAQARQEVMEKERDQLLEELTQCQVEHQEYLATILNDKELAIAQLEATRSLLQEKLQQSVEEKFTLESKLIHAKEEAVELAVQVEKLAEIAFQQATSHILEDAQQRVLAAETSAAEAAFHIQEQVRSATEGTIHTIIEQSKDAIEKALHVAEKAGDYATTAVAVFNDVVNPLDELASIQSDNIRLRGVVNDLESQLAITRSKVDKLKGELEQVHAQAKASEKRAEDGEKALVDFQETSRKITIQQEEEIKSLLEKMKKDVAEKNKVASETFKADLESIKAAIEAARETAHSRDDAYIKRFEVLQRSLRATEAASKMWRDRAVFAESLLSKDEEDEDAIYIVNGGRIDHLTDDDSQKWKLLSEGPRREIAQWMARRIRTICPKFPPRKVDVSEALTSNFRPLDLPKPDEIWSIAQEKLKEGDTLIEHVIEKETIEKKRKALERALQRKTTQWQRTPEETKLEPGTGTGHEIVFQGFNWESWRRQWYLELAPKAADLSQCGVTAVWFPPPTESVAPQEMPYAFQKWPFSCPGPGYSARVLSNGSCYMPSDLYNLSSAYGTMEELKHCIEEMHSQDLLALGDVVLNHRCAQKQSPNGVWNIYGGKLAWGPEAIVCDDPNFQGRGNPSSGDIFHAAPNIDHSQEFVRRDIKDWLNWLRNDIGFDGWRLDFVRGFSGSYVKEYIETSNPAFAIGEYWDSLAYENGSLCYNQDAHRQRIVNWINATGGTSSAFDVTTKGILHSALHGQYWRLIDPQGKPTGVMGWWPSRAVTFLENHDTGSTQGHWPFPRDKLTQGYAYILTHPGTPTIFYDHLYDFGIRDIITELVEARRRAGIHCRSSVKIYHANNDGYVAQIGDELVMKLGHFDWNPSKENNLEGSWQKFVDKGSDYQIWLRR